MKTTKSYRGYIGTMEWSKEDKIFYGKVIDTPNNNLCCYEGETQEECQIDFENAVDDMIGFNIYSE